MVWVGVRQNQGQVWLVRGRLVGESAAASPAPWGCNGGCALLAVQGGDAGSSPRVGRVGSLPTKSSGAGRDVCGGQLQLQLGGGTDTRRVHV